MIWSNAKEFNEDGSEIYEMAEELEVILFTNLMLCELKLIALCSDGLSNGFKYSEQGLQRVLSSMFLSLHPSRS